MIRLKEKDINKSNFELVEKIRQDIHVKVKQLEQKLNNKY